jgi:Na+/melibiose symporter-like transporter
MSQHRFEPKIPASERPQTHALDRVATGVRKHAIYYAISSIFVSLMSILPKLFSLATCDQVGYIQTVFYLAEVMLSVFGNHKHYFTICSGEDKSYVYYPRN